MQISPDPALRFPATTIKHLLVITSDRYRCMSDCAAKPGSNLRGGNNLGCVLICRIVFTLLRVFVNICSAVTLNWWSYRNKSNNNTPPHTLSWNLCSRADVFNTPPQSTHPTPAASLIYRTHLFSPSGLSPLPSTRLLRRSSLSVARASLRALKKPW